MKTIIWILYFFLAILIAFPIYADPISSPVNLPTTLNFADEIWQLGYSHEDNDIKMGEYVTNNENVNNWTRLVTVQKFKFLFPKEVTPVVFANDEIAQLKNKQYAVAYNIIESNPQEATIEFRIIKPESEQQDELQRLIRTPDDELVIFHYVTKKVYMGKTERIKWINLLKSMSLSILETPYVSDK